MKIELQNIRKAYGATPVLEGVSLDIQPGEFFFLLGPSGCGKTTLLRMIGGFAAPDSGEILFDGMRVNDVPPEKRGTPMVFQSYALWPHLTVFENAAYSLRLRNLSEAEIRRRTMDVLEAVRMVDFAERSPNQLSGGQQQRVAIARALAAEPKALLFDEPLSNLDAKLRIEMREELLELHRRRRFTAVYVTHDQEEAMTMATRMAVLDGGRVHQVGAPHEVYTRPKTRFVAEFMGAMNWLTARVKESGTGLFLTLETPVGTLQARRGEIPVRSGETVLAGFRPFAARLDGKHEGHNGIECEILQAQYVGASQRLVVRPVSGGVGSGDLRFQIVEANPERMRREGERVRMTLATEDILVLTEDGDSG